MTTTKIDVAKIMISLTKVNEIADTTDNVECMLVCNMFKELCEDLASKMEYDDFTMAVATKTNSMDDEHRHNIAGGMNSPSVMQEIAFKEEEKDG